VGKVLAAVVGLPGVLRVSKTGTTFSLFFPRRKTELCLLLEQKGPNALSFFSSPLIRLPGGRRSHSDEKARDCRALQIGLTPPPFFSGLGGQERPELDSQKRSSGSSLYPKMKGDP